MSTVVIVAVAVFFLGMGGYALAAPAALVRPFRLVADSPESRSEVRAVYGGFGLAIAVLLTLCALDVGGLRPGAVLAVGAALAGMALGRVVSRLADAPTAFYPIWFYGAIEAVAAGLLFAAA
ncbi:DUF4345 family protein [Prauserella muralis]|uniref:DUF4345 domain-containing protein n=1 Tax=Prauserella muralis TaxID=588067 RepID=A0A2V4B197_9PSEU|nr:DUF4345 family protein [Prauserella muralis]PXY28051.1 DUF4345 domain-containing protein [Prauserella muralis]TWE22153.1 uncharacterized protein DUF4345 [Prauserella muralis]